MAKYFFRLIFCLPLGGGITWMSIFEPRWGLEEFHWLRIAISIASLFVFFYGIENAFQFYMCRSTVKFLKDLFHGKIQIEI